MKQFEVGDHVKGAVTSKHYKMTGTVINPSGSFMIIQEDLDCPNPLSWKSAVYGDGNYFCLDKRLAIKLKDK